MILFGERSLRNAVCRFSSSTTTCKNETIRASKTASSSRAMQSADKRASSNAASGLAARCGPIITRPGSGTLALTCPVASANVTRPLTDFRPTVPVFTPPTFT